MIYYELKKFLGSLRNIKFLAFLLILLIAGDVYTIYHHPINPSVYKTLHQEIQTMSKEKAKSYLQEKIDAYEFKSNYIFNIDNEQFLNTYTEKYGEAWIKEQILKQNDDTLSHHDDFVYQQIMNEMTVLEDYQNYRSSIEKQYEEHAKISIFAQDTETEKKISKKVYDQYHKLNVKELSLQPELVLSQLYSFELRNIISVVLIFYLVFTMIYQEKETGVLQYSQSMRKGKRQQVITKFISQMIILMACYIVFYLFDYMIYSFAYGFIDLMAPIQSFSFFSTCPYAWNTITFMLMSVLATLLAFTAISSIVNVFAYYWNQLSAFLISILCFIGITALLIWCIRNQNGLISNLNYLNILFYMHPEKIFSQYNFVNLNIIAFREYDTLLLLLIVSFICIWLSRKNIKRTAIRKTQAKRTYQHSLHSFMYYEMKKILIIQKALLIGMISVLGFIIMMQNQQSVSTANDYMYNSFVDTIGAYVSKEADEKIKQQEQYYQDLENQLMQEQNVNKQNLIAQKLMTQQGFERYKKAYDKRKEDATGRKILKEDRYRLLYETTNLSKFMITFFLISFLYILPTCFYYERKTHMLTIQNTTRGKYQTFHYKVIALSTILIVIFLTLLTCIIIKAKLLYPDLNLMENIQCLDLFYNFPIKMPIFLYYIMTAILQILSIICMTVISARILKKQRTPYIFMLISLIFFVLPIWFTDRFAYIYQILFPHEAILHGTYIFFILILVIGSIISLKRKK